MKREQRRHILHFVCFAALCFLMIVAISAVFKRKTTDGAWDSMNQIHGYQAEPENTLDVVAFGSSHIYCAWNPMVLYETGGIRSYVLATQRQPLAATYYYMKYAFRTQTPRAVVLECYMAVTPPSDVDREAILYDAIDPYPWSLDKVEMIFSVVPPQPVQNYLFSLLKYHSRYASLTGQDFDFQYLHCRDAEHGYVYLDGGEAQQPFRYPTADDGTAPGTIDTGALDRIRALCAENGAELILLLTPYQTAADDLPRIKALQAYAEANGLSFYNCNGQEEALGIDYAADFYDPRHFNCYGAEKASRYFAGLLSSDQQLTGSGQDAGWDSDLAAFRARIENDAAMRNP